MGLLLMLPCAGICILHRCLASEVVQEAGVNEIYGCDGNLLVLFL